MPASTTTDELPPLTNEDVEVLYNIVTHAQTSTEPTFRALFQAYDIILAEQGIDPNHDQVFFRYLLRMGEEKTEDGNPDLFSKFQKTLAKEGIIVELKDDGEGVDEITRRLDSSELDGDQQQPVQPSRRASFSSVYEAVDTTRDGNKENIRGLPQKTWGQGSYSHRPASSASNHVSRRSRSDSARPGLYSSLPIRGRVRARAASEDVTSHSRKRDVSTSSRGSISITRNHHNTAATRNAGGYGPSGRVNGVHLQGTSKEVLEDAGYNPEPHYVPPEMLYRPTQTEMNEDAQTFRDHCSGRSIRQLLQRWRQRTDEARLWAEMNEDANAFRYYCTKRVTLEMLQRWRQRAAEALLKEDEMIAKAEAFDKNILLRQALEQWHGVWLVKKQEAETTKFFAHLERRADKARNLFLLTKAFTHWAQYASEEVLRTSVARRHILRTKYFNAWRDITAVNDFKVRRQVLHKFLDKWRRRAVQVQTQETETTSVYEGRITRNCFQRWLATYRERRALCDAEQYLMQKYLARWREIVRQLRERAEWVDQMRNRSLLQKDLLLWSTRTNQVVQTLPLLRSQVIQRLENRILHTSFSTWLLRTRQSQQAEEANRLRILRYALTKVRIRFSISYAQRQIANLYAVQCLYKWIIATRGKGREHTLDERAVRNALTAWHTKTELQRNSLKTAEQVFKRSQCTRLLSKSFTIWREKTGQIRQQSQLASSIYEPKLLYGALQAWINRTIHVRELNIQAEDAQFYVFAMHALKKWKDATQVAKKQHRREAYATVRRNHKMKLVHGILQTWRGRTARIRDLDNAANRLIENRTVTAASRALIAWHNRATTLTQLIQETEAMRRTTLLSSTLKLWNEQHQRVQSMSRKAETWQREIAILGAGTCFRKLNWRLFQMKQEQQKAIALRERNWEKHIRAMMRFWLEQALALRAQRRAQGTQSNRNRDPEENVMVPVLELSSTGSRHFVRPLSAPTEVERGVDEEDYPDEPSPSPLPSTKRHTRFSSHLYTAPSNRTGSKDNDDEAYVEGFTALDASAFDLNLDLNFPTTNTHSTLPAGILTSTPGYLKTPSKRATALAKARERTGAANLAIVTPAVGATPMRAFGAATAPPAVAEVENRGPVTPFRRKLLQQGYRASGARGAGAGRRRGVGFVGFEDIGEGSSRGNGR
ncbi:Sfi1-domain-containing protein [Patellaria atrata CBS 101060]|uniref:Sfi1-domain-containing protein n=1 Tax=Patellaria atrata CBS 101060 TaxID=1346257 RepID=A0A9P4SCD7_9PEZI|nr:Sfi1-domain-containing protein [Patellaria atrata CBS 101060]